MKKPEKIRIKAVSVVLSSLFLLSACASGTPETTKSGTTDAETAKAGTTAEETTEAVTAEQTAEATTTEEETEAPTPAEPKEAVLYQLVPETTSLMMSYVIVTPEKKIVVIDGGIDGSGVDAKPYLPSAIRAILGLKEGEYFEVEAWFLSHEHRDHYYELAKMLRDYTAESNYKINNFYFDFPDIGVEWDSAAGSGDYDIAKLNTLKKGMDNYYKINGFTGIKGADIPEEKWNMPEGAEDYYYDLINGAVINTESVDKGLTIDVDGVAFNVLLTWSKNAKYVNSTSVIIRMVYGDHSVLFLGDCDTDEQGRLLAKCTPEQLKSDYVQMGHHGQGGPNKAFYDAIDAANSKRLWPTPSWVWNDAKTYKTGETRTWVGLPFEAADYNKSTFKTAGNDFVAGLYKKTPGGNAASKVSKWTEQALKNQLIAVFEGPKE